MWLRKIRRRRRRFSFKRRKGINRDEILCKAIIRHGKVQFSSEATTGKTIENIIEADKKYGIFTPINGSYFTYRVLNEDKEITNKQVLKAIRYSFRRIEIRTKLKFKPAGDEKLVDFRIEFRTVESDPDEELTKNTLMYHYYPIQNTSNTFRGLCVINKAFYWTSHGKGIDMHLIDPINYPEPNSGSTGETIDLDQVYTHELGHGLGLPHATEAGHIMSPSLGIMAEYLSKQDVARFHAKYEARGLSEHIIKRWLRWLVYASDR